MPKIVVIEDSAEVLSLVRDELVSLAYEVLLASDGESGLTLVESTQPDAVILDVMLPGLNGISVLRRLREQGFAAPILLLTARGTEADRVAGLELGADDYMVKPFSLRELSARVSALLRRKAVFNMNGILVPTKLVAADCEFDESSLTAKVCGQSCTLSQREATLLQLLMRSSGRVMTREWLLEQVWGRDYDGEDRTVDACVLRLRERLGRGSQISLAIESVRGLGYRLKIQDK